LPKAKLTVLIDGDIIAYKAACVHQQEFDLGDDVVTYKTNLPGALKTAEEIIDGIANKLNADAIIVGLTGPLMEISNRNFRKELLATYKGNRSGPKPILLASVKEHIRSAYDTKIKDGMEADDTLGILLTHPTLIPGKKVLVSTDKDLLQIPGRHYNPDKEAKRVITEVAGDMFFMRQTLTGDPTDNYSGCPKIGPKRADAIMQDALDANAHLAGNVTACIWPAIVATYEKKGLTEDDALIQARCARILRHTDYDFKRKEPILWSPK
jgi:DNA polymerase-1